MKRLLLRIGLVLLLLFIFTYLWAREWLPVLFTWRHAMKFNRFTALLLATVLALASIAFVGCATTPGQPSKPLTEHQQIEQVCIGVSASYAAAAVLNDRKPFSAKQQQALTRTSTATDKVCTNIPNTWAEVAPEFAKAVGDAAILSKGGTPP